jgi:hypothetical protein
VGNGSVLPFVMSLEERNYINFEDNDRMVVKLKFCFSKTLYHYLRT